MLRNRILLSITKFGSFGLFSRLILDVFGKHLRICLVRVKKLENSQY